MKILEAETFSTCRWYTESRILYEKNSQSQSDRFPESSYQYPISLQHIEMPPKLRARSTSRSRTAVSTSPASSRDSVSPKRRVSSKSARKASKSPARGRTPKVEKSAKKTPKSVPATPKSTSRSRSRSRGRPTTASRAALATKTPKTPAIKATPASTSQRTASKSQTRTPVRNVVKTTEIADDDDTPSRPTLRQRPVRNATESATTIRPGSRVFSKSPSRANKGCWTACVKKSAISGYNTVSNLAIRAFNFLYWLITLPYVIIRTYWHKYKPKSEIACALIFIACLIILTVGYIRLFPKFHSNMIKLGDKHIVLPSRRLLHTTYGKIAVWSENVHNWAQGHWQYLSEKLNNKATQTGQ
ncbi:hypothetical protein L5515_002073 [Caenorhabditis briggsae]|uniref:Uncharacterized protein n=2 Tax=Caenorhabditis briggsae TaxID=6238 RepID=A0AAE9E7B1_CAEBR|nr:hypothetical protein L5515_002073 [Caenorhabditis briggsae]